MKPFNEIDWDMVMIGVVVTLCLSIVAGIGFVFGLWLAGSVL